MSVRGQEHYCAWEMGVHLSSGDRMQLLAMDSKAARSALQMVEQAEVETEQDPSEGIGVFRGVLFTFLIYVVFAGFFALGWFLWTHLRTYVHP